MNTYTNIHKYTVGISNTSIYNSSKTPRMGMRSFSSGAFNYSSNNPAACFLQRLHLQVFIRWFIPPALLYLVFFLILYSIPCVYIYVFFLCSYYFIFHTISIEKKSVQCISLQCLTPILTELTTIR